MKDWPLDNTSSREGFRDIDLAFARLLGRLAPGDPPDVGWAAMLVSRASAEGHVCIDLKAWSGREIRAGADGEGIVRCPPAAEWMAALRASPLVDREMGNQPLVCDQRGRVYLQRVYQHEQRLAEALRRRAEAALTPDAATGAKLAALLARYFPATAASRETDRQAVAALVAAVRRLCIISGAPGTGKTTTVAKILALLLEFEEDTGLRIHVCAPTGKAAARMGAALAEAGRSFAAPTEVTAILNTLEPCTIHRLLKYQPWRKEFHYNASNPLPADVVVVDEASMVDLVLMDRLVAAVPADARLIVLGDKDQLASVEAGSVFGDLCRGAEPDRFSRAMQAWLAPLIPTGDPLTAVEGKGDQTVPVQDCIVVLRRNYRFDPEKGIGALTRAVNDGDGRRVARVFADNPRATVQWDQWRRRADFHKLLAAHVRRGYETYLDSRTPDQALAAFSTFMVLCALAAGPFGVEHLNHVVADLLQKAGLIGRSRPWYAGRPVMVLRNDYRVGLFNGDIGVTWPDTDGRLRVWFPGEGGDLRAFSPQRLPEHQTVFAMTVHKSQGSEFERVLLVLPEQDAPVLTRELVYTGCSRARRRLILAAGEDILIQSLARTVQRASGLHEALWPQ